MFTKKHGAKKNIFFYITSQEPTEDRVMKNPCFFNFAQPTHFFNGSVPVERKVFYLTFLCNYA